jgi:hypothetical protein
MWKTIHMQMKILFSLENNAKMRIKMDKILEKWDEILSTVKHEHDISDISFDTWIRPLEVYGVEGNTLYILVPSEQMTLSYISKKYYLPLKVTIAELTGTEYEIQFILPEQTKNIRTGNNSVPKKNALSEKADRTIPLTLLSSAAITVLPSRRHLPLPNLRAKHTIHFIFMEDLDLEKLTLCIPSVILY